MAKKNAKKHGPYCECKRCFSGRRAAFIKKVELMEQARPPASAEALVPVRAHWRKQSSAYTRDARLRLFILQLVKARLQAQEQK